MDEKPPQNGAPESRIDFNKAEFTDGDEAPLSCSFCRQPIYDAYFEVNGKNTCESCRYEVEKQRGKGSALGRLLRAAFAGGAAGVVGAGIYYAVVALTGYEIGLVAIVVGFIVGFAVRWGSGGTGGRVYQALAVAITYFAIVSTYVPFIFEAMNEEMKQGEPTTTTAEEDTLSAGSNEPDAISSSAMGPEAASEATDEEPSTGDAVMLLVIFALFVLASPFLAGIENVIGILIIGFALYQAWKLNVYQPFQVAGPFKVGRSGAAGSRPMFSTLGR